VEKPLAVTAAETAVLAGLIDRGTAPVTTAMFLRCAPALRRVGELLAAGALGEVVGADLRFSHPGLLDGLFADDASWMLDPRRGGTGAFADLGIHLIDLLCWLRPAADVTVQGARLRVRPDHVLDLGGTAVLEWDGAPTALHAGWTSRPGGVRVHIEGTRGSVTVRDGTLSLSLGRADRVERHAPPAAGDALSAFLADLRGEGVWRRPGTADMLRCAIVLDEIGAIDRALRRDA
ncbi:MAG: Gfo/Idh/MocA family protein, partial [Spirillospora sp.]